MAHNFLLSVFGSKFAPSLCHSSTLNVQMVSCVGAYMQSRICPSNPIQAPPQAIGCNSHGFVSNLIQIAGFSVVTLTPLIQGNAHRKPIRKGEVCTDPPPLRTGLLALRAALQEEVVQLEGGRSSSSSLRLISQVSFLTQMVDFRLLSPPNHGFSF